MADTPASNKTEKPTPERLKKARERGRVPESKEVPSALTIAALVGVLALTSGWLYDWFVNQTSQGLSFHISGSMGVPTFAKLLRTKCVECFAVLAPFLVVAGCVSILSSLLTGGWALAPAALRPDLSRLSPIKGLKSLFSWRSLVRLLVTMTKFAVLLAVVWYYLSSRLDDLLALRWTTPGGMLCGLGRLIVGLGGRIAAALMVIAGADLLYQRWNYKRQLRMTRQEVKEERKQHEISPELRGRIRSVQTAVARRRMLQEVPNADVVVTNPSHYAVALRYEAETMQAPRVVAKGADYLCEKIKEIAAQHDVPVVERPELARTVYAACEVGETIPQTLFVAVAEILAMIYRLRKSKRGTSRGAELR